MSTWILEPRDPFIARDARPFTAEPGARAVSLPLPPPSTIAGIWRTRRGRKSDGTFDTSMVESLLQEQVAGPLLAELSPEGEIKGFFAPAPADAVIFGEKGSLQVHHLVPTSLLEGEKTNLPQGCMPLSFMGKPPQGKPSSTASPYWSWKAFERWLLDPTDHAWNEADGTEGPVPSPRMHVAVLPDRLTAADGQLFMTEGRNFQLADRRLALTLRAQKDEGVQDGLLTAGGERRISHLRPGATSWPLMPKDLATRIARDKGCRLFLLTPGLFAEGWCPNLNHPKVKITLAGASLARPLTISGWDLKKRAPKPTRRSVPMGAVYFLRLEGSEADIKAWVEEMWLKTISDDAQDCRDGFGVAVLGTWKETSL